LQNSLEGLEGFESSIWQAGEQATPDYFLLSLLALSYVVPVR